MRRLSILILVFINFSCIRDNNPVITEEVIEKPGEERKRGVCDFDLSDKEGEFSFLRTWELAGFQNLKDGKLDHLICLARVADFALNGEDWDNLYKVTLTFTEIPSKFESCQSDFTFEAISFGKKFTGCYIENEGNISFHVPDNGIELLPNPARNTLPIVQFDYDFLEYLKEAKVYQIEKNKLYIYGKAGDYRMTFVALED
ncbi:hypothetical protein M3O96_05530 [Aquiflexum sp. TKW24L]|uniref:hypothetical protein n=1 Tax=Aquiflexum sp. TKW24L TaxID=2942212 RepID=UPI0020C0679D|nr:hypothetical protein [Aquiflexum sp. TKW24L]MCL6258539.1 hypothetical protein [Aquiflexum sp. TKW24L]